MKYLTAIILLSFLWLPLPEANAADNCGDYHYSQYEARRNPTYRSRYINSSTRYSAMRGYDRYRNNNYHCGCGCNSSYGHSSNYRSNRYSRNYYSNNRKSCKSSRYTTSYRKPSYSYSYSTRSRTPYGNTSYGTRSYMRTGARSSSKVYMPSSSYNY